MKPPTTDKQACVQAQREQIQKELRRKIYDALQAAKDLSPCDCLSEIKTRLLAIQQYCETIEKKFLIVEEKITCDRYELGGSYQNMATLLRGPDQSASVAICVTDRGSLLHRNSCPWVIYRDAGDIHPIDWLAPAIPFQLNSTDLSAPRLYCLRQVNPASNQIIGIH